MTRTLHAVFDGEVLRPKMPLDLEINRDYIVTIKLKDNKKVEEKRLDPVFNLSMLARETGISDLATEHDHYLYGTPKRNKNGTK